MSKTCNNCGNIFEDDANICPRCGTQYIAIRPPKPEQPELPEQSAANGYQQPYGQPYRQPYGQQQYQQPYGQPYQQPYSQPYQPAPAAEKPMSVGSWLGTILLTSLFGIISIILLFVWAFGSDVPIAKKNYCRAMLIVEAIGVALSIIIVVFFVAVFSASGIWEEFIEEFSQYGYSF